ncbi:hypothetical protein [Gimesia sp.]|uniref:hypothetical protein n=1 Tax=Gimesia sp. TaxID=2024833 RepID=UPI000C3962CB|nr:hypothetical protein [Gimesia sp.]MAX36120.1 hypothetical protein [Gimesia sp.]HAH44775.1 hypothetical protein [Planctomycetaceae bacterium]HBL45913.1 hypothetical protein [Planctomycetaceae bacterium]|tara:strand:+ start:12652 stop:13173 length:522 start_codon:yes stop_codon:yes gene_type:complete
MHEAPSASAQTQHRQLLSQLSGILHDLEPIQNQLLELYQKKSQALRKINVKIIDECGVIEAELTRELQFVLLRRQQLLQSAGQQGLPADSLHDLLLKLDVPKSEPLFERIAAAQQRSKKLRHETWVQWIVSTRSYQHYTQVLELIAHAGQKVPTYSRGQNESGTGGVIFDASA